MAWHGHISPPFRIFIAALSVPSACKESYPGYCQPEKRALFPSTALSGIGKGRVEIASRRSTSQLFGGGAILSADDKSVIRKYENVGFLCPGHCQFDFSG
jgi:hypothetical protein